MRNLVIITLISLLGCGSGGGDDSFTDARECVLIINDNSTRAAEEEAEEEGLEVARTQRGVNICGNSSEIDAVVASGEPEALANALSVADAISDEPL